jgi:hypothetical protein
MFKGYSPLIFLWLGGLAAAAIVAFSQGQIETQAQRQSDLRSVAQMVAGLRLAFENFSERSANDLARLIELELTQSQPSAAFEQGPFTEIALLEQRSDGQWVAEWARRKTPLNWTDVAARLPMAKVTGDFVLWGRAEAGSQRPNLYLALQLKVKGDGPERVRVAIGQLPLDHLAALTDPLKRQDTELFLVDTAGYSLTFPDPQYVGSPMDVHPVVAAAVRAQALSDFADFRNLQGQATVGGFEKAAKSNVYVIGNLPVKTVFAGARQKMSESFIFVIGLLIFLSIPLFLWRDDWLERVQQLQDHMKSLSVGGPGGGTGGGASKVFGVQTSDEGSTLLEGFTRSLYNQIKGPVYLALGRLQRLQSSGAALALRNDLMALDQDLQAVRTFVDRLGRSQGPSGVSLQPLQMAEVVESQLVMNGSRFQKLKILTELQKVKDATIKVHRSEFEVIVDTLISRAIDLLFEQPGGRKLVVRLETLGPTARLSLLLHGVKRGSEEIKHMFDLTRFSDVELFVAKGLAVAFGGTLYAEDSLVGLRLFAEFPVLSALSVSSGPTQVPVSPVEPSAVKPLAGDPLENPLAQKKVDEKLNQILPPKPTRTAPEVSVVEALTASQSQSQSQSKSQEQPTQPVVETKATSEEIRIRKPKVRIDP